MTPFRALNKTMRIAFYVLLVAAIGGVSFGAYGYGKSLVVAELYGKKMEALANEYEAVRARYNLAVEKSAVTQLLVKGGKIAVVVRGADQQLERIETPFSPDAEVHVDFVVRDSRLFIRRVYDDKTAPKDALMIDPKMRSIDWSDPAIARGITVYRGGLEDGRWVVSSTGNGALTLTKLNGADEQKLRGPPPVQDFEKIKEALDAKMRTVSTTEVLTGIFKKL